MNHILVYISEENEHSSFMNITTLTNSDVGLMLDLSKCLNYQTIKILIILFFVLTQAYTDALEILLRVVGEYHASVTRVYINLSIYHEDLRQYEKAYDYMWKLYNLCLELFGEEHPRTHRAIANLRDTFYKRMAIRLGRPIPDAPPGSNIE